MRFFCAILAACTVTLPVASQAQTKYSAVVAEELRYRDYVVDLSRIQGHVDLETARATMRKQIDIAESVSTRPEIKQFWRTVRVELASDLAMGDGGHARGAYNVHDRVVKMTALIGSNASSPVLIHELAHAVHYQLLPQGAKNAKIIELYEAAKQSGRYPADSYALRNEREFWAVMSTIYLNGSDGYPPFTRARLKEQEPELYAIMNRIYGEQPGEKPIVTARATLACYDVKSAGLDPRLSWVNSFACR